MKELIEDIEHYLRFYQRSYSAQLRLNGVLREIVWPEEGQKITKKTGVPVVKSFNKILPQRSAELESYYQEIKNCTKCALHTGRKNFVFGYGNPNADLLFVGEAPGREEDEQGMPFVGPAGRLLDRMLSAIGLKREDVYIANILKCRPPNNRDPLPDEVAQCEPYLQRQIELIQPKIIVALGRIAGQSLLKTSDSLSKLRQSVQMYQNIPLLITYHPAALLRNPRWKEQSWQDLKKLKNMLKSV